MVLHHWRCSITGLLGELFFLLTRAQAELQPGRAPTDFQRVDEKPFQHSASTGRGRVSQINFFSVYSYLHTISHARKSEATRLE